MQERSKHNYATRLSGGTAVLCAAGVDLWNRSERYCSKCLVAPGTLHKAQVMVGNTNRFPPDFEPRKLYSFTGFARLPSTSARSRQANIEIRSSATGPCLPLGSRLHPVSKVPASLLVCLLAGMRSPQSIFIRGHAWRTSTSSAWEMKGP